MMNILLKYTLNAVQNIIIITHDEEIRIEKCIEEFSCHQKIIFTEKLTNFKY